LLLRHLPIRADVEALPSLVLTAVLARFVRFRSLLQVFVSALSHIHFRVHGLAIPVCCSSPLYCCNDSFNTVTLSLRQLGAGQVTLRRTRLVCSLTTGICRYKLPSFTCASVHLRLIFCLLVCNATLCRVLSKT